MDSYRNSIKEEVDQDDQYGPGYDSWLEKIRASINLYWLANPKPGKPTEPVPNIKEEIEEKKEVDTPRAKSSSKQLKRKRIVDETNFDDRIELIKSIVNGMILSRPGEARSKCIIDSKRKSGWTKKRGTSFRRSEYLGVSRNDSGCQVLIAMHRRKTYLGSFDCELEGALIFDFYSILLHSLEAKTNFSYTAFAVNEMIKNYEANDKHFLPKEFLAENKPEDNLFK